MTAHLRLIQSDTPLRRARPLEPSLCDGVEIVDLRGMGEAALNDHYDNRTFARRQRRRLFWRMSTDLTLTIALALAIMGLAWAAVALVD